MTAHGKTLDMRHMVFSGRWPLGSDRDARPRDRSLRGKHRRIARKAARKAAQR